MAELGRLTKEEWDDLEPLLERAERAAHENFVKDAAARALLGEGDRTPGYLLLQHLKKLKDDAAIRLFRAMEMYHHEITRADIAAAYLRGKAVGRSGAGSG
jgi:hypothetical protein